MADAFLDPNINAWWLDRSSPNDAAAASGFRTGVQMAQQKRQDAQQQEALRLKALDQAQEQQRTQLAIKQYENKMLTDSMKAKAQAELNSFVSTAAANGTLADPKTLSDFYSIGSRWAPFIDQQTFDGILTHTFKPAQDRADKAAALNARPKLDEMDGQRFVQDPNTGDWRPIQAQGQTIEAFGPNGELISRVTSGGKSSTQNPDATVATQTDVQKQAMAAESAVTTGVNLLNSLTPDVVGARGFFNENVVNEGLAQIFPEMNKGEVASGRSMMRAFNEKMIKSIKADSQLNQSERKALESALPQFGVNESLPSAKTKIATFIEEARKTTRINSERTKRPVPEWAWTTDETVEKFRNGEITQDKARQLLKTYHYKLD